MKRLLTFVFAVLSLSFSAQKKPDNLLGKWVKVEATGRFEFFKTCNIYNAKIIWLANPKNINGVQNLEPLKRENSKL